MTLEKNTLEQLFAELTDVVGDRFSTNMNSREVHSKDESYHIPKLPDAVIMVHSTEEVSEIVKLCAKYQCPVIPFGAGTSLEGQVIPESGGVSLDFTEMNKILRLSEEDLDVTLQAGVTRRQLATHLRTSGLFFSVDPGADATFGGMAATRASGTNAVRYGTMRDNVLGLTVVMADGEVIKTGGRARKSSAGYDLTKLMIGSEGTLGIITELTVRLYGRPEAMAAAVCDFESLEGAVNTVIETVQMGIPVARIEFLDEVQIDAINKYSNLDYPLKPTLFLEFHGTEKGVVEQAQMVGELAAENGGNEFQWSDKEEEKNKLWRARHDAAYACKALRPGAGMWATDVCVPVSRLAECILETRKDIDDTGLLSPIVGHVGDGNFHTVMLVDTDNEDEMKTAIAFNERLLARSLAMGGTITGEHGIGTGKMEFLLKEHGPAVNVMKTIKQSLDPLNILNPGKVVAINS
ncbi:FAD-binding protein [Cocleimonas sp. KMM 6892]|uniref:FAD-binding oxidoreductase n=1 Tax=unclassified Cocleimonas TaxID=2639732 RepID=UPI002DB842E5|nr:MULTISPECIES: FAD-linked oxidase C-terminal domain-containing protein [unclassified Cocleimonas]MEB8433589.1 FAD-binding protein [Cocleimonas sp. KMM 6892]MEC4716400.1 FAD-binding protein [Cocleimonas sp. KMM 6895]MEC4745707.1 FAD-binding protein [Cocleimonas sp. KMM 6896]